MEDKNLEVPPDGPFRKRLLIQAASLSLNFRLALGEESVTTKAFTMLEGGWIEVVKFTGVLEHKSLESTKSAISETVSNPLL